MADGSPIRTLEAVDADALPLDALLADGEPVVLRGIARDWGLVHAGSRSTQEAMAYLRGFDAGVPIQYSFGGPEIEGRPFYNDDFTRLNFEVRRGLLAQVLDEITDHLQDARPPTYYIASLLIDRALPGFSQANDLGLAARGIEAPPSIWIGNRVVASCHFDAPDNLACCAVGRRQFTLFPPEQIENLYPGPFEPTPGGQVVSVVDFDRPDFARYPRFRTALASARTALLEPGDALFIPSMWWHHVRSLEPFNVLVNYWWRRSPAFLSSPLPALHHALWTLRDLPAHEKQAWAKIFEYYVFGPGERAGEHLPEQARDLLGPIDETQARRIRAMLLARLNR
ncbi:cupin-like domain-containing protein [Pseudoxanthomonas sp. LH2527]|uniref:cupin-like domain-containing protein n=1 Tax=Pseudoxanthomonas sp. LH2527 TaxID=2923249 RepID=UPI001F13A0B6|nr:cupin-like domain-containing protein [Pseudoxanthomonas sp. LH2527]MCH6482125.1 cupin-like domain-containing protein [Pseudoxanthomonas sp. LH2527]